MTAEPTSPHSLDGAIAVVTGAAQGLGLGTAEQLARDGATAIIADLQLDKARTAAAQLQQQGLKVEAAQLDVTDSTAVNAFFEIWSPPGAGWTSWSTMPALVSRSAPSSK